MFPGGLRKVDMSHFPNKEASGLVRKPPRPISPYVLSMLSCRYCSQLFLMCSHVQNCTATGKAVPSSESTGWASPVVNCSIVF
jgi:hypothetical protein